MKRILLISIFIFMLLPLSNQAQVSGYNGNHFIINAGITTDMVGFYFDEQYTFIGNESRGFNIGGRFDLNYIFQRDKSIGLMVDFDDLTGRYGNVALPDYETFPFDYDGYWFAPFAVKSNLIEISLRWYEDGHIAPLGKYFKFMGGVLLASHEFDMDKFRSELEKYDLDQTQEPSDVEIPLQSVYKSPYLGVGYGESFPIFENLFLDLSATFRVFLIDNFVGQRLRPIKEFGRNDWGDENNLTKEDIVKSEVLMPAQICKTFNMNISLRYTF